MKKYAVLLLLLALALSALPGTASADSAVTRIKDISKVQGVRSNQLMGYGLVVGLDGTGDGSSSGETVQSIANMLTSYGITVNSSSIKLKNVAAVMVTATLQPFVREGDSLDVTVSSIGDAKSLRGGTLLQTPLRAGNGEVYVVAQGAGYMAGVVSQYVIFILGLSSLLHWFGVNAELARVISACCEGIYLYVFIRLWVFRGVPEPEQTHEPSASSVEA